MDPARFRISQYVDPATFGPESIAWKKVLPRFRRLNVIQINCTFDVLLDKNYEITGSQLMQMNIRALTQKAFSIWLSFFLLSQKQTAMNTKQEKNKQQRLT